jgi:hypothetical protein
MKKVVAPTTETAAFEQLHMAACPRRIAAPIKALGIVAWRLLALCNRSTTVTQPTCKRAIY